MLSEAVQDEMSSEGGGSPIFRRRKAKEAEQGGSPILERERGIPKKQNHQYLRGRSRNLRKEGHLSLRGREGERSLSIITKNLLM